MGAGTVFTSTAETLDVTGDVIGSLTDHWSWALTGSATTSTFLNQDLTVRVAPALEYNVFPYGESTRRQLTFSYGIGLNRFRYKEVTIFDETEETRVDGTLTVSLDLNQPWGASGFALEVAQFLDDPGQHHVVGFGNIEFRIFRGLSLDTSGSASRIRDQIFLSAGGLAPEEVLLRRRQQETGLSGESVDRGQHHVRIDLQQRGQLPVRRWQRGADPQVLRPCESIAHDREL